MLEAIMRALAYVEAHAVVFTAGSLAMLCASLTVFPFILVRLPRRYFAEESRPRPLSRHPLVHWILMSLKNLLGLLIVLVGFLLFFLPGQGLLTLIIGLTIMNYPGKFQAERWLVRRPRVMPALNWIRARFNAPPFEDP
jgi:hypothetical protein